jgi:hypothetical protein
MPTPRKPTAILDLTGRLRHDPQRARARANEPVRNEPLGNPPTRLNAALQEVWREILGKLVVGVALESDAMAFESLVRMVFKERDKGELNGPDGARLDRLYARFGMTPSDRSRVSAPKQGADKSNPFKKLG